PEYRVPVFTALGESEGIDLTVWAGLTAPGAPAGADPAGFRSFAFREAANREIGPLLSQPAQFDAWRESFDVIVYSWNSRYIQLIPALLLTRHAGIGSV